MTRPLEEYQFGPTSITVWPDCVITKIFGQKIHAGDSGKTELAESLGYGNDTFRMTVDHEIAHTWIAWIVDHRVSRVLHYKALGSSLHPMDAEWEEEIVLTFQRGLDKAAPRPWERWSRGE